MEKIIRFLADWLCLMCFAVGAKFKDPYLMASAAFGLIWLRGLMR